MKTYDNILEELNSLECTSLIPQLNTSPFQIPIAYFEHLSKSIVDGVHASIAGTEPSFVEKNNNFTVPEMYFQTFPEQMLAIAKNADNIINKRKIALTTPPFSVPDNYFQKFEQKMLALAQGSLSVADEWKLLIGNEYPYNKNMLYSVSGTYFNQLSDDIIENVYNQLYPEPNLENSILNGLNQQNPFSTPDGLFSEKPENKNELIEPTPSKTIAFQPKKKNKFAITSVAAAVILLICFGFWKLALPENTQTNSFASIDINTLKEQITEEGIERYISVYDEEFVSTYVETGVMESGNSYNDQLKDINKASIDEYLEIIN